MPEIGVTIKMAHQPNMTRRQLLARLATHVDGLISEQARIGKKLEKVTELLLLLSQDPNAEDIDADGFKLDEDVQYDDDNPEYIVVDDEDFRIGEDVQLRDSKKKKWSTATWKPQSSATKW